MTRAGLVVLNVGYALVLFGAFAFDVRLGLVALGVIAIIEAREVLRIV